MWERMKKWFVVTRRNCRGGRFESSIYSKTYTEGSDPFESRVVEDRAGVPHGASRSTLHPLEPKNIGLFKQGMGIRGDW